MNRDEILNMPAGREMDALVAEKIMGLVPCTSDTHIGGFALPCHAFPESPDKGGETKQYSTDIAAAWEVVEKITEVPQTAELARRAPNTKFGYGFDRNHLWAFSASDAASAICHLALLAILED